MFTLRHNHDPASRIQATIFQVNIKVFCFANLTYAFGYIDQATYSKPMPLVSFVMLSE